ncbi:MAG: hypothetical protein M3N04_04875 [Actinomycetota bacterium]|nr:hypothetical protein [Actinomycetota bacterium]
MRFGKRRQDADAADPPDATKSVAGSGAPGATNDVTVAVTEPPPLADRAAPASDEPAVEGEAVELPPNEPAAPVHEPPLPPPGRGAATRPDPMPFPVADEPVAVVTPGSGATAPVTSLGESGEAFASGHAAAPGPSWQEPVMELANERPELVVAAAFAGGVLAAMILRRLGS